MLKMRVIKSKGVDRDMKYLICGAGGQLGKAFADYFNEMGLDYSAPDEETLDITDPEKVKTAFQSYEPDVVINCAAYNAVDVAEDDPAPAFLVNAEASKLLAENAAALNARFVHYSSDYVFDGRKGALYSEEDDVNPLNEYGKSKLAGEKNVLSVFPSALVFRLSWVIGPGEQNFIFKLRQWAKANPVLRISADEVSVPTFADDIVLVTMKALDADLQGLFHLVNSDYASRYELARAFLRMAGCDNVVIPVPVASFNAKADRPLFSAMSNRKLSETLGIDIPSWQDSLNVYVKKMGFAQ